MKPIFKSAVLPQGFKASGIVAHIKKSGKKDLALFYSDVPCVASGMFTKNKVKAAPVVLCERILKSKVGIRAVIANSGNANCMTGEKGLKDAFKTAQLVAETLGVSAEEILVSSTGIIGKFLPIEKIRNAIPALVSSLSDKNFEDAAVAIMTTDTFAKVAVEKIKIGSEIVTISGVAKGAGMIAPDMRHATMLAYIMTDVCISKSVLDIAVSEAVEPTFNSITIDGCMSTNDTVIVLANGASGSNPVKLNTKYFKIFSAALKKICLNLAKMIVEDAEGATKFIKISVSGSSSYSEAKRLAMSVANSNLFKCAMFGSDPNWGRIAAALGSIQSSLELKKMNISLNGRKVLKYGRPVVFRDKGFLKGRVIKVDINLGKGKGCWTVYTSDLSYEYVHINANYN